MTKRQKERGLTVRMPPDVARQVEAISKRECRSLNSQIIFFIREGIKRAAANSA